MRWTVAARWGVGSVLLGVLVAGCGVSLPLPVTGPHSGEDPIPVPYPPPPAKVEVIPPQNLPYEVWVDGQWFWTSRRWEWRSGQWQLPPKDSYYAYPMTVRLGDGTLVWFPGTWKRGPGKGS